MTIAIALLCGVATWVLHRALVAPVCRALQL